MTFLNDPLDRHARRIDTGPIDRIIELTLNLLYDRCVGLRRRGLHRPRVVPGPDGLDDTAHAFCVAHCPSQRIERCV